MRILLTHPHIDHICGLQQACERYHLPVTMHEDGLKTLSQAELYGSIMNFRVNSMKDIQTEFINDGDKLGEIECRYVPGHCPGSMAFVLHEEKVVITGDALFRGSIGRTDLPGGDMATLMASLKKLTALPDDTVVIPGHGMFTTIGDEKRGNPFLQ